MMDLEGMIEKIPSTEKILGVAWILSWVLAIWMYHIQFFLTGLFCLFLVLILVGKLENLEENKNSHRPHAIFSMDKNTNTLRVQKLYEDGLKWDEHEICSGSASLPNGTLKEGDVVKDCKGNVALRHVPSNTLFGGFNFGE
jgi:hypothetical protein